MRLTVFGPGYPFRGGIASTTTRLVGALTARGHEVLFLTPSRQYPRWLYPGISDRDPEACPPVAGARPLIDPFNPVGWRRVRRTAEAHEADAWVIPYWTSAWSGLWSYLLGADRRPAVVAVVHNPFDHDARPWQRLAARRVLGRCDGLFTHAASLARELEHVHPTLPVAHHRLPAAAAPRPLDRGGARAELGLPEGRRVALFLGLIRPYKGVDLLLEAAAALPAASDWFFLVAGEPWGGLADRLRRQAASLGLEGRVRLDLGWVPEGRVGTLLAAADLLVLPYRRGSQSAVAPLALTAGLPVLSTAVGGVPELVVDGDNGIIVPPGDAAAITAALERLDPDRLARLAEGARRSVAGLDWDDYASVLEELIGRVVR
ncbi:MAG: glycosyltransferase family 4 protein [Thermoanaerobaculales bacterium]|nr:glycosyltransferase family 4 protein [Thermoanaerobaculales bacterium]